MDLYHQLFHEGHLFTSWGEAIATAYPDLRDECDRKIRENSDGLT